MHRRWAVSLRKAWYARIHAILDNCMPIFLFVFLNLGHWDLFDI